MRALILLAAIVLILALVGWVTFGVGPGRSSVNLETEKIRQDTEQALETGADALRGAEDAVRNRDATPAPNGTVNENAPPAGSSTN